ncbi:MAG TPA: XrtA-associated tyrosine autokinase [Paraburkholderia sp.]|uniref:XrtA-associated tyrosine autokinase n=1 Tax=Paraburkholderia sp. TaxID=1926495 RepID=UPI002B49F667|nr:XrtA-associated tyrosine autokinase [Paraburkholderia sp.]HKR39042.1 XrtA-associated tyrosine autokinase [Paraburkholderia sp.]
MSLVEQAIKKIQASAARADAAQGKPAQQGAIQAPSTRPILASGVVGEVIDASAHRPSTVAHPVGHRTDKIVRVNRDALRVEGLLPPEQQERAIADQYRHIKRPLIANATGRGAPRIDRGQLIMIGSAFPGEGKTFTSINLALSMALEKDLTVLLVDADVAKPHISRIFGAENEPGLLDTLRDEAAAIESFILPTDVPNLCILPAGRKSDMATELLASQRMDMIVRHLAASNPSRIALIDSPPLLLTTESRALAQSMGQVVLVVRAGFTPQQAVLDAIEFVGANKSLGIVLNQSTESAAVGHYYGYGESASSA